MEQIHDVVSLPETSVELQTYYVPCSHAVVYIRRWADESKVERWVLVASQNSLVPSRNVESTNMSTDWLTNCQPPSTGVGIAKGFHVTAPNM